MRARIYQRPKPATQSGRATGGEWLLDFQTEQRQVNDPLMGWWGSANTSGQVKLRFDSSEQAVAYAEKHGLDYQVEQPPAPKPIKPKAYADNFKYGRPENWTH